MVQVIRRETTETVANSCFPQEAIARRRKCLEFLRVLFASEYQRRRHETTAVVV